MSILSSPLTNPSTVNESSPSSEDVSFSAKRLRSSLDARTPAAAEQHNPLEVRFSHPPTSFCHSTGPSSPVDNSQKFVRVPSHSLGFHHSSWSSLSFRRQPAGSELALGEVRARLFCCKDRTGFVKGVCVWRQGEKNSVRERDRECGSKPGSGGAASSQNEAVDSRERLRRLALETIDLAKDPYFMRNHLGRYSLSRCASPVSLVCLLESSFWQKSF